MRFARQDKVIERLEQQMNTDLKKIRNQGRLQMRRIWESTKNVMRVGIREFYRRDFGTNDWTLATAGKRGTLRKIDNMVGRVLEDFHQEALSHCTRFFREVYRESVLHQAYILDMVTPDSYSVTLPRNRMFVEASAIKTYQGPEANNEWKVRMAAWIDAYHGTLNSNLRMGALNDSDIANAENEVDATRAGTPAYDMADVLDRIVRYQAISLQSQAADELVDLNPEMELEEVWQISFGSRVCEICDSQRGMTQEEAEYEIPAHPNCECFWRLVPASWAELLKSGDEDELDLAKYMDANGVVPSSMIIRNDDGDIAGKAIVTFNVWRAGQPKTISAGTR